MTCVHEAVLQQLGINPIGVVTIGTASGPALQNAYPVRLDFPTTGWSFELPFVPGVDLSGQIVPLRQPQPLIVLLGRNVLENWVLVWNGPGALWTVAL